MTSTLNCGWSEHFVHKGKKAVCQSYKQSPAAEDRCQPSRRILFLHTTVDPDLGVTACVPSPVWTPGLNKPIKKRAKLIVEAGRGDLSNVTTLGGGKEIQQTQVRLQSPEVRSELIKRAKTMLV